MFVRSVSGWGISGSASGKKKISSLFFASNQFLSFQMTSFYESIRRLLEESTTC